MTALIIKGPDGFAKNLATVVDSGGSIHALHGDARFVQSRPKVLNIQYSNMVLKKGLGEMVLKGTKVDSEVKCGQT